MTEIVEFLKARIDEDEAWARAAGERHWEPVNDEFGPEVRDVNDGDAKWSREVNYSVWRCDDEADGCPEAAHEWMAEAEHIARHDPARVLAEVEAKRRILRLAADYSPELEHGDNGEWALTETLKALASAYAAHPDFDQAWAGLYPTVGEP